MNNPQSSPAPFKSQTANREAQEKLDRWDAIAVTPEGQLLDLAARSVVGTTKVITIHLTNEVQWIQVEDGERVCREIVGMSPMAGTLADALRNAVDYVQGDLSGYE